MSDDNPYSSFASDDGDFEGTHYEGGISDELVNVLRQTRPWARICSVLGFLGAGLMLLAGGLLLLMGLSGVEMDDMDRNNPMSMTAVGVMYLLMSPMYVVPSYFLFNYASWITRVVHNPRSTTVETALRYQKSFWKFVAILSLVMIVVGFVAMGAGIVAGVMAALNR